MRLRYAEDRRAIGLWVAHWALVAFAWQLPWGPWTPLLVAIIAFSSFIGANSAHNALHVPVFKARWANRLWQAALSLPMSYPASAFVPAHNLSHHLHLQGQKDVLRTTEVRFRHNGLNLLVYTMRQSRQMMRTNLRYFWEMRTRSPAWARQVMGEAAVVLALAVALAAVDPLRWLVLVFLPALLGLRGLVAYGYFQHDGTDADSKHDHSRNSTSPLWNWLVLNNGYHGAHHDRPGAHWSKMPALHASRPQDPRLDEPSNVAYIVRAYVWPARRLRYDGAPVAIVAPTPDDNALDTVDGVSLGAGAP